MTLRSFTLATALLCSCSPGPVGRRTCPSRDSAQQPRRSWTAGLRRHLTRCSGWVHYANAWRRATDSSTSLSKERSAHVPIQVHSNVTVDGSSAPGAGITLVGRGGLHIWDVNNIIIRGLRFRDVAFLSPSDLAGTGSSLGRLDCISIAGAVRHVVIDHVSIHGCGDGGIDIRAALRTSPSSGPSSAHGRRHSGDRRRRLRRTSRTGSPCITA